MGDLEGNESSTPACEVDPGCLGADAVPSGSNAIGTTCSSVIEEGGTCEAVCGGAALPIGSFVCSSGQILHMSYCGDAGDGVTNETVEKVAATLSMELDRQQYCGYSDYLHRRRFPCVIRRWSTLLLYIQWQAAQNTTNKALKASLSSGMRKCAVYVPSPLPRARPLWNFNMYARWLSSHDKAWKLQIFV